MLSNILVPAIIVTKGNIRILLDVHILILCFSIYCFNIELPLGKWYYKLFIA